MLGAFAVGKTSLVQRFVKSLFTAKYISTVGVKIDKREVVIGDNRVNLMLWDLAGEDGFQRVSTKYLRGAHGYILVADGTNASTLESARDLERRVSDVVGAAPHALAINKCDLRDSWEVEDGMWQDFRERGCPVYITSAKTGDAVAEMFTALAESLLAKR